jgi:hypothetical protein
MVRNGSRLGAVNKGQIYLFDGSGRMELTRMTACAIEAYAYVNYNRDVYLFVDQEYLAWKRMYADILMSMPNFRVLRAPVPQFLAGTGGELDTFFF